MRRQTPTAERLANALRHVERRLPDSPGAEAIKTLARTMALKRDKRRSFVGEAQMYCAVCRRVTTFEVSITKFAGVVFAFCDEPTKDLDELCNAEIKDETRLAVAVARARLNPKESEL